jgi:Domain of unknown function (DUF3552).
LLVTGLIIGLLVIGLILGYLVRRHRHIQELMTVQAQARQIIEDATAQTKQKIATLQAKSRRETLAYQQSVKDELTEQKSDIAVREQRRQQREQLLNQMAVRLDDQTSLLDERSQTNHQQRQKIHDLRDQATALRDKRVTTLAEQAAMSTKEAEEVVLQDYRFGVKTRPRYRGQGAQR